MSPRRGSAASRRSPRRPASIARRSIEPCRLAATRPWTRFAASSTPWASAWPCASRIEPRRLAPAGRPALRRLPTPLPLPRLPTGMTTVITNAYGNSYAYLQIGETCAAGRHIGCQNGSHSGTFSRVMCRRAAHRGEKCAAICAISVAYVAYSGTFRPFFDERTHDRTHENPRNRRTNPRLRRTNPRFCKRTRGTSCRR
jgi:hypothetical protein